MALVSERIGQLFFHDQRLEFTEYGAGERWLVLLPAPLMSRRMHHRLARTIAAAGHHVLTLDPLGHGRSDRPDDPHAYSVAEFAEQVVVLLDACGADRAVVGGTSLGADVALTVAVRHPERVAGVIAAAPLLENALGPGLAGFAPLMVLARRLPWVVSATRAVTRAVPRGVVPPWAVVLLDALDQRPGALAAAIHGVFFGEIAPGSEARAAISAPMLVIGHRHDPLHPLADAQMLAVEVPDARLVESGPADLCSTERIDAEVVAFADRCHDSAERRAHGV